MKNKKIFILGMARSGFEAARLLAKDNEVLITDIKEQPIDQVETLKDLNVKYIITEDPSYLLDESFDLVVKNPGIKYNHQTVLKARKLNIPVINELELAYNYLNKQVNIIGITGSNGKTTTTTLIYEILKEDGKNVFLGGNIGIPLCNFVLDIKENDFLVLEISDHQLCDMYKFKTNISVLTNIFPVHLDFHDSFERYKLMKKRIFNNHTNNDVAIINFDNEEAKNLALDIPSSKKYFSKILKQTCYIFDNSIYYLDEKIISLNEIKLKGNHNYENIMAAIMSVKEYQVKTSSIVKVLKKFNGVPHRLEFVKNINGINFYNDSKATNCESTKIALNSFSGPTILLLGGLDRGHSFYDLTDSMKNVKYVACYGETKKRIKEFCDDLNIMCEEFNDLKEATEAAYEKATKNDTILLSPACASWDQYPSFEKRGEEFKEIVSRLGE